jgi:hypothetical protein
MTAVPRAIDARIRDATGSAQLADGLVEDREAAVAIAFDYDGPSQFRAGELARWALRLTARVALPRGACIAVAHRWPNDWGVAQSDDPEAADYLEARIDAGPVRWWGARLHTWHPFDHALFVELADGLAAGRSVEARYGGRRGFRAQTFIEEASPFSLRWQVAPGAPWVEFARHRVAVVGSTPAKLVVTVPSRVVAGQSFDVHVRVEDAWGNPANLDEAVELSNGLVLRPGTAGWARTSTSLSMRGVHRLDAWSAGERVLTATSNPVEVVDAQHAQPLYWADLHGQSTIGCGARSIDAYYAHARDFAAVDAASHQANCFLVSNGEWRETQDSTRRQQQSQRFVTLLGVEWSGATNVGGDHNLYFRGDEAELRRCSHEFLADKSDAATDLAHVEDVYRHYAASDTLVAVHVGGRTADLAWHAPDLDRLIEVHSTHATSEWFLLDALRRGYRMAVIAGSDGVDGRPGNSHPGHMGVRNVRGGLTAILASELTRAALWDALKARRCYATTGERIVLDFRAGDVRMGDSVGWQGPPPPFDIRVEGTAPIERVELYRGRECIAAVDAFAGREPSNRLRVAWRGASAQGNWQRARMEWHGGLRIEGARIVDVAGWAFDTPDEGVVEHDASQVRWRSVTAGDWDGVVVELDRFDAAVLAFVTAPMTLRVPLHGLAGDACSVDAQGPDRTLELRRLPREMPAPSLRARLVDPAPCAGTQAYWVRVRQADGALAWSTPIFADCTP